MASDDQKLHEAKQKLREPLENLVTISSSLASFTLQWQHLELFFKSIQKSIETLESEPDPTEPPDHFENQFDWFVDPLPETKQFCVDMDGKGLVSYLIENPIEQCNGLASALLFAPDPALLVLDALLVFHSKNDGVDVRILKTCVLLLEELMIVSVSSSSLSIRLEVMEEARKLAMEWKKKIIISSCSGVDCGKNYLEVLGLLLLLAVYGLGSEFNANGELLELVEIIIDKRYDHAFELCRIFGFEDKLSEFVEDLIRKKEHIEAINCIYKFGLVDKFPVYKLLRKRLRDGKKEAKEICEKGNDSLESRCEAIDRRISVVRDVISCVENQEIECKYNRENLRMRIRELKAEKKEFRRNAETSASASQWQHQGGSKRRPSLAAEGAPKNGKHQTLTLAAEGAQMNVKRQCLASMEAPKNGNHQTLTLAAEGAQMNVKRQCLASMEAPKNVASDPPLGHPIQQPKFDQRSARTSQHSSVSNFEAGLYGLACFASATNPYSSSSGGQFGFNAGSGAETRTSNAVSGLAGGLFNKKKKKIVGLVGSVAGIHKHGTAGS